MGSSLPPPAAIDLVGSAARLRGTEVEVLLARPELGLSGLDDDPGAVLRLTRGKGVVSGTLHLEDHDGERRLVGRAPRAELGDGTWALSLERPGAQQVERLDARLLVQGRRPLVLLWGAKG